MRQINSISEIAPKEHGIIVWLQVGGTAWVRGIFFPNESENSDLLSLLDDAYDKFWNNFPTTLYELDELTQGDLESEELENYMPLNGGEKYVCFENATVETI